MSYKIKHEAPNHHWVPKNNKKRAVKEVETYEPEDMTIKDTSKPKVPKGKGVTLESCPYFKKQINNHTKDDLRKLHVLCIGKANKTIPVKQNMRDFKGLVGNRADYEAKLAKWKVVEIRYYLNFFNLSSGRTRDECIENLLDFLFKPYDIEGPNGPIQTRTRKSKKSGTKKSESRSRSKSPKRSSSKAKGKGKGKGK